MSDGVTVDQAAEDLQDIASSFRSAFQTVEQMTLHFVREAILRGAYQPGQRLQQDSIAELLGVSRMPVRAALRKLEAEGLVVFTAHRGATVRLLTPAEIAEIYKLRVLLETFLMDEVAERLTPTALDELAEVAQHLRHETSTTRWIDHRREFYERLYGLADLPRTTSVIFELRAEVGPYVVMRPNVLLRHEHLGVLEFLREGDVEGAKRTLREHLEAVSDELQQLVAERWGEQSSPAGGSR